MAFAYDLAFLRLVCEQHPEAGIPPDWCEKLPEYYESKLDDVLSASATAIDLILANAESYFAEATSGLASRIGGKPAGSETDDSKLDAAHSPDFRSARWFGTDFSFTGNQAAAVRVLWEAWAQGTPDVGDERILRSIDDAAPPTRLNIVFRGHLAWGTMITPGATKGSHRLNRPA